MKNTVPMQLLLQDTLQNSITDSGDDVMILAFIV
jgi:hypothetical protein